MILNELNKLANILDDNKNARDIKLKELKALDLEYLDLMAKKLYLLNELNKS